MANQRVRLLIFLALVGLLPASGHGESPVNFNRDVRPLLSDRCFQCHGPDEHDRQAELRLDRVDGNEGAYRELDGSRAIVPGSADTSVVWERINADEDQVMPPLDSSKKPLSDEEKAIIKRWIDEGAEYSLFWAFAPPEFPPLEKGSRLSAIDQLVLKQLPSDVEVKSAADRRTLIRRLSLDLTGLPPTRAEIHEFLSDDSAAAYEKLVDRMLAKGAYGEHMAKYWMDLVRFADTNGIHHDHYREMTPYRDWVIRSFNENLSYADFVRYQLAGDLYDEPTQDQLIASGFNRLHLIIDRGTALPEESFMRNVVDRVTATGTAFLGLTVQCAVCHDHKYDPITSKDFYQLYAFFNNFDGQPETGGRQGMDFKRGLQPPYVYLANESQQRQLGELERLVAQSRKVVADLEKRSKASEQGQKDSSDPPADIQSKGDALKAELDKSRQALSNQEKELEQLRSSIEVAMVMKERAEPRPTHVLLRGAYDSPGELVERDTPSFLPPMSTAGETATRMDLANWFVAPEHPLTARVAVNRFWQQLFGVGIVKTAEDFGAQGDWPSHPELLDYLALSFINSGWDVKALMKQIVMSEAYQRTSVATETEFERDPENRWLARGSRYRLDSEVIRDQILATSGLLNRELYGKSVKPPQPEGLWQTVSMPSSYPREYEPDRGDRIYRRSVYTFWKRGMPPPQMTILNAPTREACIARRERTNTPLQALLLMNEPEFVKAARQLALRSFEAHPDDARGRLELIYETITSQLPDQAEERRMLELVNSLEELYQSKTDLADTLCEGVDLPASLDSSKLAAWTMLVSAVYNLDITKTRS